MLFVLLCYYKNSWCGAHFAFTICRSWFLAGDSDRNNFGMAFMKKKMLLWFVLCAVAPVWAQGNSKLVELEHKLAAIEEKTESMREGKEEILTDLHDMDPTIRPQTCAALNQSVNAIKTDISELQQEIAYLEQPPQYSLLDEQQKARLVEQKMFIAQHNPAIDCQNL